MKTLLTLLFSAFFSIILLAQDNVGIGTLTPHASAILELQSGNKGLLISRVNLLSVNDVATVLTPATGLLVFNTNPSISGGTGEGFYYWDGTQWKQAVGPQGAQGAPGATGANGQDGLDGISVSNALVDGSGNLILTLSNSQTINAGFVVGPQGAQGPAGAAGAQGPQGPAGPVGCTTANNLIKSDGLSAVCSQIFDNATNVGIGTSSPLFKLHIDGANPDLLIRRTNNTNAMRLLFRNSGTSFVSSIGHDATGSTNDLVFKVSASTDENTITERMRIASGNGNVTITSLAGTGTRMVVADANGTLSTQPVPSGSSADARNVSNYIVTAMNAGKKYLVCVYGVTANRGNDTATMLPVGVRNCQGATLASVPSISVNWPDGNAPQSHCFVITAPSDGCVQGFTDNGNAMYMTVVQLD
jgi:hypothetical protein